MDRMTNHRTMMKTQKKAQITPKQHPPMTMIRNLEVYPKFQ